MTCNRPIHITHYSYNQSLRPVSQAFRYKASKITISRIEDGFCGFAKFGNLKLKRSTVIYNVFIVCFE